MTTTQSAWRVAATEEPNVGSLSVDLDRGILTNNLVYAIHYIGRVGQPVPPLPDSVKGRPPLPSIYVDLLDTNSAMVAENLYGNLIGETNAEVEATVLLDVPTARFTNAAVINLRCGSGAGEVVVYEAQLYIDEDGDGLDADQERQLGTSDNRVDTDGDGVSDYAEVFVYHTDPTKKDDGDGDDGGDDKDKNKKGIIYVDKAIGDDQHTGRTRDVAGQDGPKKTIHRGMAAVNVDRAHTLVIKSGTYNENLDLRGKSVKVVIEGNVKL